MKTRKKRTIIALEHRNELYNKTILHNKELAEKNCELSDILNQWMNRCFDLEKRFLRNKWWQIWKPIR